MFSVSLIASASISPQAFAHDANPPTGDLCLNFLSGGFDPSFSMNHGTTGVSIAPSGAEFIITQTAFYDQNFNFPSPPPPGFEFGVDMPFFGLFTLVVSSDAPGVAVASGFSDFPVSTSGTIGTFVTSLEPSIPAGEYFVISCWSGFIDEGGPLVTDADLFGPFTFPAPIDTDGDGIFDVIDLEPLVFSNDFSDVPISGTTFGSIATRGDQILRITELPNPSGVRVEADVSGGFDPAVVDFCGGVASLAFDAGDGANYNGCSSTIEVTQGIVEITFFADGTISTTSLSEGNSLTFDEDNLTISADPSNTEDVIVFVDGMQIILSPGEMITLPSPPPPTTPTVGGEFLPIETTSLILAGAQSFSWMIPVIVSAVGIGLFVVSRKSE